MGLRGPCSGRLSQVRRHVWAAILVTVLCASSCTAEVQTTSNSCTVPSGPQLLGLPQCAPTNKTLEDAKAVAWRFAPIVYMHPLEVYHLISPKTWFENAEIYYADYKNETDTIFGWMTANMTNELMFMPRSFATILNSTVLDTQQRDELLRGAPVDGRNRSTAEVYYHVVEVPGAPGTWLYTYYLYYSFNGCSNQDLALSFDGELQVVEYVMCPIGIHEGDLERVQVLVCAEDLSISQTAYSQHGWWETRDCSPNSQGAPCALAPNPDNATNLHPVAHAAFESHANYYDESPLVVYAKQNATFKSISLDNLGGVWIGDRTLRDPYWQFIPTPDNIKYLPNMTEIEALPAAQQAEWEWATYPGNWGAPLISNKTSLYCISNNQTEMAPCNTSSIGTRVLKSAASLLDLVGGNANYEGMDGFYAITSGNNFTSVGAASITGPLFRTWTYQWLPERYAPILKDYLGQNVTIACPQDAEITLEYPDPGDLNPATTIDTIINYLVWICAGAVLVSLFIILLMAVPTLFSKAVGAPVYLYAQAKTAYSAAKQRAGTPATLAPPDATPLDFSGSPKGEAAADGAAAAAAGGAGAAAAAAVAAAAAAESAVQPYPSSKLSTGTELEVVTERTRGGAAEAPYAVYSLLALALWIAGLVCLAIGLDEFVNHSVAAVTTRMANATNILRVIEWLIIAGMIIIGICDLNTAFIILLATSKTLTLGKHSIRNWLYSSWVHKHALKWHIVTAGFLVLVISITAIIFGLGMVVVVIQLAVRLICSNVADVNIDGISTSAVCVTVPTISEDPICGWQVMEICYDATSMRVILMVLGSMLLLWAHVIWLIVLLFSMWRFQPIKVLRRTASTI